MKQVFSNNARTTVATTLSAAGTTLTVSDGSKFPTLAANEYFLATLFRIIAGVESGHEVVKCTARTGNVLTIERSYEGATASEFAAGSIVALRPTADSLQRLQIASNIIITPSGGLVATNVQDAINELDTEKASTSHDHAGVYEPADATILKSSAIGVTVQPYDANTAKYDDSSANFTGNLTVLGNVGIGTSTPEANARLTVRHTDPNNMVALGNSIEALATGTNNGGAIYFGVDASNTDQPTAAIESSWGDAFTPQLHMGITRSGNKTRYSAFFDNSLRMFTGDTERMRIDNTGSLLIGTTTSGGVNGITINSGSLGYLLFNSSETTQYTMYFRYNGTTVGSIYRSTTSTAYNTSSDYRLKTDVQPMSNSIDRVKQLKPVNFEWIADGSRTDGFLAHEAQEVVPEAVTGTKDAMRTEEYEVTPALGEIYTPAQESTYDDEGNEVTPAVDEVIHSTNVEQPEQLVEGQYWRETTAAVMGTREVPDYQGIDQSKLVPLLTAALQEALSEIDSLKQRVTVLEAS